MLSISFSVMAYAKQYQYEFNSETVYFSESKLVQSDLRALFGKKFSLVQEDDLRISAGAYFLYQDVEPFDSYFRQGLMVQAKQNLWKDLIYFVYEHHRYQIRRSSENKNESRYGLYGGYYQDLNENTAFDIYAESFLIPEVSNTHLLSSGRFSLNYDLQILSEKHTFDLLSEIYFKDSPDNWGGNRTDLRLGVKYQPWPFLSAKLFTPIASSEDDSAFEFQAQINLFYIGDL